jgi:hypothetical protein
MNRHIFIRSPRGTHTRKADGVRGNLKQLSESAVVEPISALVDPDDFELIEVVPPEPVTPDYVKSTAEEWIARYFSAMRVVALQDMEHKLAAAAKSSPKLAGIRQWIDGIVAAFLADPTPKVSWAEPPHTFEDAMQEAVAALTEE